MPIELYPYQEEVLRAAAKLRHPALFLEMRLGKTIVAIRLLRERKAKRVLIVAPLSVVAVWLQHLADEGLPTVNLRKEKATQVDGWHVVNFEYLLRHEEVAEEWWDAVVVDESTRIRNPKAKTTKIFMRGFEGVKTRMILSGCPAPEGPLEYGPQFIFLVRNIVSLRNFWAFRKALFQPSGYGGYTWVPRPGSANLIRKFVADHAVVLKRQDAGVGGAKVYETRTVEPNSDQDRLMQEVVEQWAVDGDSTQWAVVVSTWLARLAGGHHPKTGEAISDGKAQELADLLSGELSGQQAVVFFRFNDEIKLCERVLCEWGIGCESITGETPVEEREAIRQRFASGKTRVALIQLKCGKMGLDFSAADTVVYYSNGFSLEDRLQSEDRIIHPAKKTPLLYVDLVTRDSLDEDVVRALKVKGIKSAAFLPKVFENFQARVAELLAKKAKKGTK